jgi:hypothetical protein
MTVAETLYNEAQASGIEIINYRVPTGSLAVQIGAQFYIGLDEQSMKGEADTVCHLAHEMGHCYTHSMYALNEDIVSRRKCERKANVWSIKRLVPRQRYEASACDNVWDLAEEFSITVQMAAMAAHYYKTGELNPKIYEEVYCSI